MFVLVDYDNIDKVDRGRGLGYIALKVLDLIGGDQFSAQQRVSIRLYGGWFQRQSLTRSAQTLSAEIARSFPTVLRVSGAKSTVPLHISVELAHGPVADPKVTYFDTFRQHASTTRIVCVPRPWYHCQNNDACGLMPMAQALMANACPTAGCPVEPQQMMDRPEQKLVDTMLVADLIYLSSRHRDGIAVVSNDDDMWPGIMIALLSGARLHHVHPKRGARTPGHYASTAGPLYFQTGF
jgi:hypothetical protein